MFMFSHGQNITKKNKDFAKWLVKSNIEKKRSRLKKTSQWLLVWLGCINAHLIVQVSEGICDAVETNYFIRQTISLTILKTKQSLCMI